MGRDAWEDDMDALFLQILNGLDKGGAYALIALGLTLVFGTLGVVNFAHGALFMLGAFCAVSGFRDTDPQIVRGHFDAFSPTFDDLRTARHEDEGLKVLWHGNDMKLLAGP